MPNKLTQAEFLAKAVAVHGDRYDYSLASYTTRKAKVSVICQTHGVFEQQAHNHINGHGCIKCRSDAASASRRSSLESFLYKARAAHGDKYDYSQVSYVNCCTNVIILCSQHGSFYQSPDSHYSGAGCQKCANVFRGGAQNFIDRALQVHGDKYNYSQVIYKTTHTNVIIKCSKHGLFQQAPHNHLAGKGCAKCAKEAPGGAWTAASWASRQAGRMALLYLVRLSDNEESFYKVGITLCSIKKRLRRSNFPYQIEPVTTFASSDAIAIHQAESGVKKRFKMLKYLPSKSFPGRTECYTDIGPILEFLATQDAIKKTE